MSKSYSIYFAGDLFDHKHITGNHLLAKEIENASNGLYTCILPQEWEGMESFTNAVQVRNKDIKSVIEADLVLFNFDGTDLDSGTVVEFMIAKMLDIPAVLLRTELRNGGYLFNDDWNLMVHGYPRCITVKQNAITMYNQMSLEEMHRTIAQSVVDAFKKVLQEPPLLTSMKDLEAAYRYVIKMCGGGLDKVVPESMLHEVIQRRFFIKERRNEPKNTQYHC